MPRLLPPIKNRFPVNRKDHVTKGPYLAPLLKRLIEKKINYIDPETQKKIKGCVKDAVLWRLIANATEGDTTAIREILDRIDGKVEQKNVNELSGNVTVVTMGTIKIDGEETKLDVGDA